MTSGAGGLARRSALCGDAVDRAFAYPSEEAICRVLRLFPTYRKNGKLVWLPVICQLMSEIRQREAPASALERMAGGTTMAPHQHPGHQLIYVSTGLLVAQTSAGSWVVSRDRAIWMPAMTWHEHRAYGAAVIHTLGFDVGVPPLPPDSPAIVAVTALLRELLVALTDPATPAPEADRLRAVLCDRLRRTAQEPISLPAARDPRLACACAIALERSWVGRSLCRRWPKPRSRLNGHCLGSSARRPV